MATCPYQILVSASFHEPTGPCSSFLCHVQVRPMAGEISAKKFDPSRTKLHDAMVIRNTIKWYHDSNRSYIFSPENIRILPFTPTCKMQRMTRRWVSDFQQKHNNEEARSLPLQQVLQYYRTVNLTHPPEQSWGRTSGLQAFQTLHGLLQSKRRRQRISRSRAFSLGWQLFSALLAAGSLARLSAQT